MIPMSPEAFHAFLHGSGVRPPDWAQIIDTTLRSQHEGRAQFFRIWKEYVCSDENILKAREEKSPSGIFSLKITTHPSPVPNRWSYTKGQVFDKDGALLATVLRNYGSFPFAWVEGHPRGDFLLCGEDYQGQTLVNLQTGLIRHKLSNNADKGWGFCWAEIHPSPLKTRLAVNGCFWACPYETYFYDFSDPESMEWPLLKKHDWDVKGWREDGTCDMVRTWEVVDLPGHPLHERNEYGLNLEDLREHSRECQLRDLGDEGGWADREEVVNVNPDEPPEEPQAQS